MISGAPTTAFSNGWSSLMVRDLWTVVVAAITVMLIVVTVVAVGIRRAWAKNTRLTGSLEM